MTARPRSRWSWPGLGQDRLGCPGPRERLATMVPGVDEDPDRLHQIGDAGEGAAADRLASDDPKEDLDQVHPTRRGRGEVQSDPWVARQPRPDPRMPVGAVVVEHDVQLAARVGLGDLLTERQELGMALAGKA